MRTSRASRYDVIVFFSFHSVQVHFSSFLGVFNIAHIGSRSTAASLAKRHFYDIASHVEGFDDVRCDVDIDEVEETAREDSDLALRIGNILFDCRQDIAERLRSNARQTAACCQTGQEHRQMTDHRLTFGNHALSNGSDAQHRVEEVTVSNRIETEFMDRIEAIFLSEFRT